MKSICVRLEWDEIENELSSKDVLDGLKMFLEHIFKVTRIGEEEVSVVTDVVNKVEKVVEKPFTE